MAVLEMRVAGIDDAGRGSVIGPLVIAGILIEEQDLPRLREIGVKDSKLLSPDRRAQLEQEIRILALQLDIVKLAPAEIDQVVENGKKLHKLNRLEAHTMARVIETLKPNVAYVDASDVLPDRFKQHVEENVTFKVKIISEHKADAKYPVVSAASIIAKVERDKAVQILTQKYGEIGAGYPSDHKTIRFLEKWITKYESYPDFVRKSWKTAKMLKLEARSKQTRLA
jgi:ribonuclease HII